LDAAALDFAAAFALVAAAGFGAAFLVAAARLVGAETEADIVLWGENEMVRRELRKKSSKNRKDRTYLYQTTRPPIDHVMAQM
jgi:hypothetical protein